MVGLLEFNHNDAMTNQPEILDEQIVGNGPIVVKRRWLRGAHPHLGKLHIGYTGIETIQETEVIQVLCTFEVLPLPKDWENLIAD